MSDSNNLLEKSAFNNAVELTVNKLLDLKKSVKVAAEPIEIDGLTLIPISKVSVGFAGGGADITDKNKGKKKNPAGTGAGISETPVAFLVVEDKKVEVVNVPTEEKPSSFENLVTAAVEIFKETKQKRAKK